MVLLQITSLYDNFISGYPTLHTLIISISRCGGGDIRRELRGHFGAEIRTDDVKSGNPDVHTSSGKWRPPGKLLTGASPMQIAS
ncbi:unnamed protein product [Heligmosomoides polygyrus]|uniref:Uncharacterized protein n=1 Tax=Heligmosomoides polygyrus TaxID=6339 RepID=A0A183FHJ6_HELPZ|nr:unnamed protein product [Heligmosomoides polygyrus]